MRRIALAAAAALAVLAAETAGEPERAGAAATAYALVALDGGADARTAAHAAGGRAVSPRLGIWQVPAAAVSSLRARGLVAHAEPDRPRHRTGHLAAGDEHVPAEWWLPRVGGDRVEPPGPGRPLTIIDSGLDVEHPDFAGRAGTELLNEQTVTTREDFHGTAVSSVAAAAANGVGLVGLYPNARLLSWDATTSGVVTSADVISGLEQAAARGPGIVNISLGGPRSSLEADVVADVFARGTIVVAASGNEGAEGSPPTYPASLPHVVTVGATDTDDAVASFSSRSAALDVVAPGEQIPIAVPLSLSESGYGRANGTSFSSPMVAAALAWTWTQRPQLEKTQLLELLRRSARDLPPAGKDTATGFGLLDMPRLLELAAPTVDPFEPNDDLDQVRGRTSPPRSWLTTPSRGRSRVAARLDRADDPRDLYGLWLPARRRLVVTARSPGDVDLALAGTRRRGVAVARRRAGQAETMTVTNTRRTGAWVVASVFVPSAARPMHTSYTATVTTGRIPR
jgi:hypothetical protein